MDSRKRKGIIGGIAIFLAATMLIGGTLAWTDFTQTRTNRFRGSVYYDATLHDDFDGENKDVYVENSGENTIYVRVRLDEYMQIGNVNMYGQNVIEDADAVTAQDKNKWETHLYSQDETASVVDCGKVNDGVAGEIQFHKYYEWNMSGDQIPYDPGTPGVVSSVLDGLKKAEPGEAEADDGSGDAVDAYGNKIPIVDDTKGAKTTLAAAAPITMARYIALLPIGVQYEAHVSSGSTDPFAPEFADEEVIWGDGSAWEGIKAGCWILDEDGWAYWSQPLEPGTATNLLLDDVKLVGKDPTDDWYYAIDVKLQAVSLNETKTTWQTSGTYTTNAEKLIESWHGDA